MNSSGGPGTWAVEHHREGVDALHELGLTEPVRRLVRWCEPDRAAIVLGSAQPDTDIDHESAAKLGVEVVRRRSGGGAVLVEPDAVLWVDVIVPTDDPLWQADVGRAFWWLGDVFAAALADVGYPDATVHRGALVTTPWSRLICFAGLGPGEVSIEGRKVVGISQRRTRAGALFQCAVLRRLEASLLASLLAIDDRSSAEVAFAASAKALPDLKIDVFRTAFLRVLRD